MNIICSDQAFTKSLLGCEKEISVLQAFSFPTFVRFQSVGEPLPSWTGGRMTQTGWEGLKTWVLALSPAPSTCAGTSFPEGAIPLSEQEGHWTARWSCLFFPNDQSPRVFFIHVRFLKLRVVSQNWQSQKTLYVKRAIGKTEKVPQNFLLAREKPIASLQSHSAIGCLLLEALPLPWLPAPHHCPSFHAAFLKSDRYLMVRDTLLCLLFVLFRREAPEGQGSSLLSSLLLCPLHSAQIHEWRPGDWFTFITPLSERLPGVRLSEIELRKEKNPGPQPG